MIDEFKNVSTKPTIYLMVPPPLYVDDIDDSSTSFLVNSRTLMGCTDPLFQRPLGSAASYLMYADVRTFR